jgi:sialate O-acetylesterase
MSRCRGDHYRELPAGDSGSIARTRNKTVLETVGQALQNTGMINKFCVIFLSCAALGSSAPAELRIPAVIGSNMVMQRDEPIPIWGWAKAGDEVTINLGSQDRKTKTGEDGRWGVKLDALPAGGPHEIKITGSGKEIVLSNVLVGEVWLCSGQSNMEWSVRAANNAREEMANAKYPSIRLFHVPKRPATTPQDDVSAAWKECTPQSVVNFSAVGYYFGRHLHGELNVPIGLIGSAWGGTRIEPWTPLAGFEAVEAVRSIGEQTRVQVAQITDARTFVPHAEKWAADVKAAAESGQPIPAPPKRPGQLNHGSPTGLYNGMIAPLVPFAMRGAIWYQGESNNGEGMLYHEKMKALIAGWRKVFDNPELAFHFVQLAPFRYGNGEKTLPYIWEAQTATLAVPGTGMAVITDIGNVGDIHPRNKQDVGKRLALWAMAKNYGKSDVVYSGPLYKAMEIEDNKVRIKFSHVGGGLISRDGKPLSDFSIAGTDGKFVPAEAQIDGATVVVSGPGVSEPKNVRFGWHHMVNPNLSNKEGLPAGPFKTDDWKGVSGE